MGVIKKGGITFAGVSTLQELQDVAIDTLTLSNGQILKYNALNDKWENKDGSGTELPMPTTTDVDKIIKVESDGQGGVRYALGVGGSAETEIPGTLAAGETTVTLQNAAITTNSKIDYYADVFGVHPINAAVTNGQIVLTYRPRATAINIKVVVS